MTWALLILYFNVTQSLDKLTWGCAYTMENTVLLYGNRVYGEEVSKYGLENGYLDYLTLAKIVGPRILKILLDQRLWKIGKS